MTGPPRYRDAHDEHTGIPRWLKVSGIVVALLVLLVVVLMLTGVLGGQSGGGDGGPHRPRPHGAATEVHDG
jgi:hypothetical protein